MLDQFKNPPMQYRPAPFWVWKEAPDPEEIDRQVREMYAKGIGGFFIDGQFPGRIKGSGEELLQCVQRACELAERLGLSIYQYDEPQPCCELPQILETKLRTSSTHADGRIRTLARLSGADTLSNMKRIVNWQACLGINFFCPDEFNYSLIGQSPNDSLPQFYQASHWPYYRHFADYAARLGYVLSQGRHHAQAVIIRPGRYSDSLDGDTIEWLAAYCELLLSEHIDFDILDEDSLSQASCADEHISLANENYELLILPPLTAISYSTAKKIRAFSDEGGRIIGTMTLPAEDSDGDRHAEIREIFVEIFDTSSNGERSKFFDISKSSDLATPFCKALHTLIKRNISIRMNGSECSDIIYTHRSSDSVDIFFLANDSSKPREVRISIRCDGAPHMLNLETGDSTALPNCTQQGNRTILLYRFEPHSSLLIAFSDEPAFAIAPQSVEEGQEIALSDEWEFILEQPNCITIRDWTYDTLAQDKHDEYDCIATFDCDCIPDSLLLALEMKPEFLDISVFINGHKAPISCIWIMDVSFKTIDIASFTCVGKNTIRVHIKHKGKSTKKQLISKAMLFGSFGLDETHSKLIVPRRIIHNGSWTDQGYPFYSGTAIYRQTAFIPEFARGQRVILRADNPANIVEFVINGEIACARAWAPYETDITSLVKPGANLIELRVTNTLANMLLSQIKPSGLLNGITVFLA